MANLPWFKFNAGDWLSDGKLRRCRAEGIAVWIQAIASMHIEDTCALTGDIEELAMLCNLPRSQFEEGLAQLEKHDVADVVRDSHDVVTITSRRLSREHEKRADARERKRKQRAREKENDDTSQSSHGDDTDTHACEHASSVSTSTSRSSSEDLEKKERVDFEAVEESWNEFASDVGLPSIRKLNDKRRRAVRQRWDDIWPHIEDIYAEIRGSPFLLGQKGDWTGATFDFVWCRTDAYLKILEGNYRGGQAGKSDRRNGTVSRDGGTRPGTRGEMSEGLSEWVRRHVEKKRDGELTNFEYAIGCGYDVQEVLGIASPGDVDRYGLPDPTEGDCERLPPGFDATGADDGAQDWSRSTEIDSGRPS